MLRIISLVAMALPLQIIIYAAMALLLAGAFVYQLIRPAYAAKKGRQVDVRVLSCRQMVDEDEEEEAVERYGVTVDFYGLNGEVLVKTLQSEKPYTAGDVIRCCYLDKTGRLFPGTAREIKAELKHSTVVFFIFFFVFMGVAAAILWGIPRVNEKPELALLVFGYVVSILFMAVGMLGIYKRVKMRHNIHSMRSVTGVLADYTESGSTEGGDTDNDESAPKVYYPVYEYDWGGETRRLSGTMGISEKKDRAIGIRVHILLNPQTGEAICREDEKTSERVALVFGIIGVAVFALMMALSFGVLANDRGRQEEGSVALTNADMENASILELVCYHEDEELEICDYWITVYEDGSGHLLLFPVKTVSEKSIDQEIRFTVSQEDMEQIMQWIQGTNVESLAQEAHRTNETTAYVSLTIYDSGERYSGGGYCDDGMYAEICKLMQQVVPAEVWEEMEKRESAYYQR